MTPSPADNDGVRLSVVIPTMKRVALLRDTLESLRSCQPPPHEVIVVDADPAGSARPVTEKYEGVLAPAVHYLRSEPSLTVQRNLGIEASNGDAIVFLDDDVEVHGDVFARLAEAYDDPAVVGATGRVVEPGAKRVGNPGTLVRRLLFRGEEGKFTSAGYPRYLSRLDRPADVEFMPGCFMSARRELAARVGFDEALGGYALAEDEDFAYRLSRLGRVRYVPGARVVHRKLGFSSHDSRAFGRLVVRNRSYLFRKNFPQTRLARLQFRLFLLLLLGHRLLNRDWAGARGLLEGVRAAR